MVVQKFGQTNWEENTDAGKQGANQKRDEFMRLQDGSNIVRIVTQPHQYYAHKYKEEGDTGFGDKIMCSFPAHKACPLCEKKDRPKRRWFVGMIDRKTQTYKILDIGYTVYQTIQNYNNEEEYGNPSNYDLDIKVNRQGGATGYYNVLAKIPKPLSEADLKLIEAIDKESLVRRCAPPTYEQVVARWNTIREKKGQEPVTLPAPSSIETQTAPTPAVDMSPEQDFDFPAAG